MILRENKYIANQGLTDYLPWPMIGPFFGRL